MGFGVVFGPTRDGMAQDAYGPRSTGLHCGFSAIGGSSGIVGIDEVLKFLWDGWEFAESIEASEFLEKPRDLGSGESPSAFEIFVGEIL